MSRRVWKRDTSRVSKLAFSASFAILAVLTSSCGAVANQLQGRESSTPADPPTIAQNYSPLAPPDTEEVVLEAAGSGIVSVNVITPRGTSQEDQPGTFKFERPVTSRAFERYSISVMTGYDGGTATCTLKIDGKTVSQNSASGVLKYAGCFE